MGKVHFGAPPELTLRLKDAFGIDTFVETGTYRAQTATWAAQYFKTVYTIEGFEDYYRRASSAHRDVKNLTFLFGDSRKRLPEVLKELHKPAIIWLDAHWMGNTQLSAGTPGECALMDELKILAKSKLRHFILIDDLHCFMGDLNKGADPRQWPSVDKIKSAILEAWPDYCILMHEDVIIAVPPEARVVVEDYAVHPALQMIVLTSNKYVHCLPAFAHCLRTQWPDTPPVTVVRYDVRPPKTGFHSIAIGNQADYSWSGGLMQYLQLASTPRIFILMLEDYWITSQADVQAIKAAYDCMAKDKTDGKIDLSGDMVKRGHSLVYPVNGSDYMLARADNDATFLTSLQAALWRRDFLLDCLKDGETPWQFEKAGSRRLTKRIKDGEEMRSICGLQAPALTYVNAVGGEGNKPGEYDHKKIPAWLWDDLKARGLVA